MNLNSISRYMARRRGNRPTGHVATLVVGAALVLVMGAAGCGGKEGTVTSAPDGGTASGGGAGGSVVLMTHDSFAASDEVLAGFTRASGATIDVLRSGDAGAMLNQAILSKDHPLGDVLYGVDNTFLSRALDAGIFEPYASPLLAQVPDRYELDPEHRLTPIDFGDVALNYDKDRFQPATDLAVPTELRDLTLPAYRGMLVVENPATSSPGLAFMLASIVEFGESGDYTWLDFWGALAANDVQVTSGWEEAYYSAFSGGSGEGDRPLVVSYASSPPAEVVFADPQPDTAPTGVIAAGAFRQVEFAGVLAGTEVRPLAEQLIDFMLSRSFQEDIPLNMFVFPANEQAVLPDAFVEHTTIPSDPATMDPALIERERERWIDEWTAAVLQ